MTKTRNRLISVGIALLLFIAAAVFIIPQKTASAAEAWDGTAASTFAGGDGSETNPYQIANGAQLAHLAELVNGGSTVTSSTFFELTDDINLGGKEWTPIGEQFSSFKGQFNGNGHTISNFTINMPSDDYIGLFGYNYGTIKNLAVKSDNVNGDRYVGGVCGYNEGKIYACSFDGTVSGYSSVGGICGRNEYSGEISNCFNSGDVEGKISVGGICGLQNALSSISYCISVGTVTGNGFVGGVLGENQGSNATITYCYYDYEVCEVPDNYAIGDTANDPETTKVNYATTVELYNGDIMTPFVDNGIWEYGSTVDARNADSRLGKMIYTYIHLKEVGEGKTKEISYYNFSIDASGADDWQTYTPVTTADEFKAIKDNLDGNYVLTSNINFGGESIEPIGNGTTPFTGKFSGNGYTISNFVIIKTADDKNMYAGLFGKNDGTIMMLAAQGKVNAGGRSGGICGWNAETGMVYGCSFDGSVDSAESNIGGICGWNEGTISNCFNSAETSGDNFVGGICANVRATGKLLDCISVGEVNGKSWGGGIYGTYDRGSVISNCYYDENLSGCMTGGTRSMTGNELCDGTLPENLSEDIWEVGSISYGVGDGKFRDKTYTYPSIKGVGKAYEYKANQFNFGYAGTDDYQDYTYISNEAEFTKIWGNSLRYKENFVLKDDITLTAPLSKSSLSVYTFYGKFSGDGHTITMADGSTNALIGTNRGTIMNLAVKGNISSAGSIGGICDDNYGTIYGCSFAGKVETTDEKAGGICCNNDGTISNCFVVADVKTNDGFVGGICRFGSDSVESCYFVGNVEGYISDFESCYYNRIFATLTAWKQRFQP